MGMGQTDRQTDGRTAAGIDTSKSRYSKVIKISLCELEKK